MKMPYLSYKTFMQERYGEALFSIPINLEYGCPNRDQDGKGGCTFCPEHGARAAQIADAQSIEEQVKKAIAFAKRRYKARSFALYLQAYTNTFATLKAQQKAYEHVLHLHDFKAIYIGTRPDCLGDATLDYLVTLNQTCEVVVELGVQTLHDPSLRRINRGHDTACSLQAIQRLKDRGLRVHVHLMIGFVDETPLMWQKSIETLVALGVDGIKFHNLHIIKNTKLALEYACQPFDLLDEYEYAQILIELLRYIPSNVPIIRLHTDTPSHELLTPKWQMQKGMFSEYLIKTMRYRGIVQGDAIEKVTTLVPPIAQKPLVLEDRSISFWNDTYGDYYHPKTGAFIQAKELFFNHSNFKKRLKEGNVAILDIGFGMGYNSLECLKYAQESAQNNLCVVAIDQDRMLLQRSANVVLDTLHATLLRDLFAMGAYHSEQADVTFLNGEARYFIPHLDGVFDIIFLDPFLESNNASLISVDFFKKLIHVLKPEGVLIASTSLRATQVGLHLAGFKTTPVLLNHGDIKGIVATISSSFIDEKDRAYHDPFLRWSDKKIESERQKSSSSNE